MAPVRVNEPLYQLSQAPGARKASENRREWFLYTGGVRE